MYKHDDSDTTMDKIELRITDGGPPGPLGHTNRFTIPVLVIPKVKNFNLKIQQRNKDSIQDDSVPLVISNLLIRVRWGQQIVIRRHMLEASDLDTSGKFLFFYLSSKIQHFRWWNL